MSKNKTPISDDPWATCEHNDSRPNEESLADRGVNKVYSIIKKTPELADSGAKLFISGFKIISILVLIYLMWKQIF